MGSVRKVLEDVDSAQHPSMDFTLPSNGTTLLHTACEYGHAKLAQGLLERGARVDAVDDRLRTPLHQACWDGHDAVA